MYERNPFLKLNNFVVNKREILITQDFIFRMDPFKSLRTPTHVLVKNEKLVLIENKENDTEYNKLITRTVKSHTTITSVATKTSTEIYNQNAYTSTLLPPNKRIKMVINRQNINKPTSPLHRQPLIDISENIPRNTGAVPKRIKTNVKIIKTLKYEKRTEANDIVNTNMQQTKTKIIKSLKTSSPQTNTSIATGLNTFVVSPSTPNLGVVKYFIETKGPWFVSPIAPNIYTVRSAVIVQGIPNDVRHLSIKKSLVYRSQPGIQKGCAETFCLDIYNGEYLDDIILTQLKNDWKFVITKNCLNEHGLCITTRNAVVNWLIQVQDYLQIPDIILFNTVRIFDAILNKIPVPKNMCQLVGLTILWIIYKYEDGTDWLTGTKLLTLCKNTYSNRQLLKMEKKVLALINFDLSLPDITIYIIHYILKLINKTDDLLRNCTFYIVECYMLNEEYATIIPSVIAAAAVCLALRLLYPLVKYWERLKNVIGYYSINEIENLILSMLNQIQKVQDPKYEYRQPYLKYAVKEKNQVSIIFLRKLIES